jgi:hypothetical protein
MQTQPDEDALLERNKGVVNVNKASIKSKSYKIAMVPSDGTGPKVIGVSNHEKKESHPFSGCSYFIGLWYFFSPIGDQSP